MLSTPMPARPITLEARARFDDLGRDLRTAAHDERVVAADDLANLFGFEAGTIVHLDLRCALEHQTSLFGERVGDQRPCAFRS